jgi:hypothetical protein
MRFITGMLLLLILISSCSGRPDAEGSTDTLAAGEGTGSEPDSIRVRKDFPVRFTALINTLGSQDLDALNTFISPEFGLLIIESTAGAMPHFHIQKAEDASYRQQLELICNHISFDRNLRDEALPRIDCESKDFYTKSGSFVQDTNLLGGSEIWRYSDQEDQAFAARVIESIGKTVILTSGYTFYFTYYKEAWYLTVIDARRPCEA